jgi:hypothetical protein
MNLLKDSIAELRAAFDLAEGNGYFDRSMADERGHDQSLGSVMKTLKSDWKQPEYSLGLCIYGAGGWHRYFVGKDGEVIADPYYGLDAKKAAYLGFKVRGH